ncbi:FAD-binding protein, partial [Methylobacterium organophilum]|nr:FAD-binding protein [Methylobacterium organophilum]
LFAATTTPAALKGEGMALAARAGAEILDPEFVQFHPTAINVGLDPAPLATEALRGEGARLIDGQGRFLLGQADAVDARQNTGLPGCKGRLHPRILWDAGHGGHIAGSTQILGQRQTHDGLDKNFRKSSHSAASNAAGCGIRTRVCTAAPSVCG